MTNTGARAATWEASYALLLDHAEATSGTLLPADQTWQGTGIGPWAYRQAQAHSLGTLPAGRAAQLEAVPGWTWDRAEALWNETLRRLRELAAQPGGLTQPPGGPSIHGPAGRGGAAGLKDAMNRPLGYWVALQRQLHRDGLLGDPRAAQLETLTGWDWSGGLPARDVAMIQALRAFCAAVKHADVPDGQVQDGLPLGEWVWAVRRRKLTGRLHPALPEEIAAATPRAGRASAFSWRHAETLWRVSYAAVTAYARREGSVATMPPGWAEDLDDTKVLVYQWARSQRHKYRRGELGERRAQLLSAVPGWQWERPGRRDDNFAEPLDLPNNDLHGRPAGWTAGCKCRACKTGRRDSEHKHRKHGRSQVIRDPVPPGRARRKLAALERAGATRGAISEVCGVPLGTLRAIAAGSSAITRLDESLLLAVTAQMVAAARTRTGSRGRAVTAGGERIEAAPTHALLADLRARGFGPVWVARELRYATRVFHTPEGSTVTRRTASQIAGLHARVGDLVAPPHGATQKVPRLAELLHHRELPRDRQKLPG